jgi:hypothetical protein
LPTSTKTGNRFAYVKSVPEERCIRVGLIKGLDATRATS